MLKRFKYTSKQPYWYETIYEDFTMTDRKRIRFIPRIFTVLEVPEKMRSMYIGGVMCDGKLELTMSRSPCLDRSKLFYKCGGNKVAQLQYNRWRKTVPDCE